MLPRNKAFWEKLEQLPLDGIKTLIHGGTLSPAHKDLAMSFLKDVEEREHAGAACRTEAREEESISIAKAALSQAKLANSIADRASRFSSDCKYPGSNRNRNRNNQRDASNLVNRLVCHSSIPNTALTLAAPDWRVRQPVSFVVESVEKV